MTEQDAPIRPQLRGHQAFLSSFAALARSQRLAHGWILAGPSGIGKWRVAEMLAAWLLADGPAQTDLLGEAVSPADISADPGARLVYAGAHPDLLIIQAEKGEQNKSGQIKTEQLRRIPAFLSQTAGHGSWRVVILDSLDDVNRNGANALLKILEEPPEKTVLFCLTDRPGSLLPTIRSRCQIARLSALANDETLAVLQEIWPEADAASLQNLARLSAGSPGQAVQLAQAGALPLFEEICNGIQAGGSAASLARSCAAFGPGGVRGAPMRRSALFLFDQLFFHAARLAAGTPPPDWPDFAVDSLTILAGRHSAGQLAGLHQMLVDELQEAESRYLDFGAVLHRFFFKIHSQTHPSRAM